MVAALGKVFFSVQYDQVFPIYFGNGKILKIFEVKYRYSL